MAKESGVRRIEAVFERARAEERAALMPYLTLGFPTPEESMALVERTAAAGADLLELGVPYSDPVADGPVLQRAMGVALEHGVTLARCLDMVRNLRGRGVQLPLLLMGYYNPILAYGESDFCQACAAVGVDGFIVPDLPPEEGADLEVACRDHGLALVYLLAPTSPQERVQLIAERSQGFIYLVSTTGITGPRAKVPAGLAAFVRRVRAVTDRPAAVGFGISTPDQAREVAALADGVIIGSALARLVSEQGADQVEAFVTCLHQAVTQKLN
jgi:tryptophan synthase alpha chain